MTEDELRNRTKMSYSKDRQHLLIEIDGLFSCGFKGICPEDITSVAEIFMQGLCQGYHLSVHDIEQINECLKPFNITGVQTL